MKTNVLLTVSGTIASDAADQAARGARPRPDYLELARSCGADLIDYAEARRSSGMLGKLLERIGGPDLTMAWVCFRRSSRYKVIFTDGEQIGIPLAALLKLRATFIRQRPRHLMITHIISVPKKMVFLDWLKVQSQIDLFFVYASWQKQFIEHRWGIDPQRVVFTPFMVDSIFFSPAQATARPTERPMICSAGLERRDYPTLMRAVSDLDLQVVIAAASPWAKQPDSTQQERIPANVSVQRYSQHELRQVYADSRFVVMPLYNVEFQAGVTAILEAMAMGKAVVCTRTVGQTDVVVEGETGLYVPPDDPQALRNAIAHLIDNPQEAERMGQAGRRRVEQSMSLDCYVERLSGYVNEAIGNARPCDTDTPATSRPS